MWRVAHVCEYPSYCVYAINTNLEGAYFFQSCIVPRQSAKEDWVMVFFLDKLPTLQSCTTIFNLHIRLLAESIVHA